MTTSRPSSSSPMKGATMLATLQTLGVMPSFSRPSVSNDNPYSESLFKTLKYHPAYPRQPFANLLAARQWVGTFVQWYNHEHRHSAIRFVTPGERHAGLDTALLGRRVEVYEAAKRRHPELWSGATRNWQPIAIVYLNPDQHVAAKGDDRTEQALKAFFIFYICALVSRLLPSGPLLRWMRDANGRFTG